MSGFEVARQLRERYPSRRFRLVAYTAIGRDLAESDCQQAGFDAYLQKPVPMADFVAQVKKTIEPEKHFRKPQFALRLTEAV